MIRRRDDATMVITQTAHGWLAGQFALRWGNDRFQIPAMRRELTLAAANHDNGWLAWEDAPRIDRAGRPTDFLDMPPPTHVELWQRGIDALAAQSRYAALLVSKHARFLVEGRLRNVPDDTAADRAALSAFSEEQQAWEAKTLAALRGHPYFAPGCRSTTLATNLRLLQIFDWLSLLLCMSEPAEAVVPDVPTGSADQRLDLQLRALDRRVLALEPWPFDRPELSFTVQARQLPAAIFADDDALKAAWATGLERLLVFQLRDRS